MSVVTGHDATLTIGSQRIKIKGFAVKILPPAPTRKNLAALADTVQSYEQSIVDLEYGDNLEAIIDRWYRFGHCHSCKLCESVGKATNLSGGCMGCVLSAGKDLGCVKGRGGENRQSEMGDSCQRLIDAVDDCDRQEFIAALKKRLAAILKRVDERGYELVKR